MENLRARPYQIAAVPERVLRKVRTCPLFQRFTIRVLSRLITAWNFPFPPGSMYCLRPVPRSVPSPGPGGPQPVRPRTPVVPCAESNRSSPSGPRHTRLDTRPVHDRVSPLTPGAPNAPAGTHTNNPGNPPQIPAPGSAGPPFALPGRASPGYPTGSSQISQNRYAPDRNPPRRHHRGASGRAKIKACQPLWKRPPPCVPARP